MEQITGLIGRDDVVDVIVKEIKKGKHIIITGAVGVGKSAVLRTALEKVKEKWTSDDSIVIYITDHQAKGQFVDIVRQMLANGVISPKELRLNEKYHEIPPEAIQWDEIKNSVARMGMRDLISSIIPALARLKDTRPAILAVDDLTSLSPTQSAFWLALFDHAQIVGCASEKKDRVKKMWWKMKEIEIKPLDAGSVREIVTRYITAKAILIESPDLYISHVIKQSGGNPQAINDMLNDSSKERIVDKKAVRAMRHEAGIRYLDFTPILLIVGALIVSMRYIGMGTGDKILYIISGMSATAFIVVRYFIFKL